METRTVILTGFKPFGSYKFNPTMDCVNYYNMFSNAVPGYKIIGTILPCTYFGAFNVLSEVMDIESPYAVISMGLSSSVHGVRIESTFRNLMNGGKYHDTDGYYPKDELIDKEKDAKAFLSSNADNVKLANILSSTGIPVETSANANTFICNSLGYLTSKKILENNLPTKNVLLHIPWTDNYESMISNDPSKVSIKREDLYKAIDLLILNI